MAAPERLVVALLAAGRSSRFGAADKLLAPLADRPLIHWAAQAGASVKAAHHIAIIAPAFPDAIIPAPYRPLINPTPEEGLAASLRLAARFAREAGADALLILLADMPLITSALLAQLLAAHDRERPVMSRAEPAPPQPPALFPSSLFAALEHMTGDQGARTLAANAYCIATTTDLLRDVDRPADLALCAHQLGAG